MILLSLDRINEQAPYYVMLSPKGNYIFETERGIHYSISFEEDTPFGGCETYQFIIDKIDRVRSPHDPKVEKTILAIIDEFFAERQNVLLYICDTSDGREANRNRLFLSWFEKHAQPGRFTIRTANAVVEGQGFYAAIIVENNNPKLTDITEDFERTAQALTADKPQE
ncbi:MAG: hypothetical protein IJS63_10540 [Bacteroidaceae bacterium]|nr:hypothetical protein [Bacteroidaceae bacterium]